MRLKSLDVFRGITIAGMILVNQAGVADRVYAPLAHASWNGCTPADLVFPFFLFAVGSAMALSAGGAPPPLGKVLRRAAILFGIGLLLNGFYKYDLSTIRVMGVLQRIALAYAGAALLMRLKPPRAQPLAAAGLLVAYWLASAYVPVPGFGAGVLTREGNFGAWVDRWLISAAHLYQGDSYGGMGDPEGAFSTLPAVVSVMMGWFCGCRVLCRNADKRDAGLSKELALAGLACLAAGAAWGLVFPLNKKLWTSSYVLYAGGWAVLVFAACYELIEVRSKTRWAFPFEVLGVNSLFAFVASVILIKVMVKAPVGEGSLFDWINGRLFASWAGPLNGPTLFAFATLAFWWVILYLMERRRWRIKA